MGILNKIFGKSNTIKVQFIDSSNGNVFAISEMPLDQLPETFEIQTTMHLNDEDWTVEEAIPPSAKEFLQTKNLTLKMSKVEYMDPKDLLYTLPTISNETPRRSNSSLYNDFDYSMQEDDWRQIEFLNKSSFPHIEIEIAKIEKVKLNDSEEVNSEFTAFKNCHVRDTIGEPNLVLDVIQLNNILKTEKMGSLKISDEFVENGFSLKTESTTFYGIIEKGIVSQFCIGEFSDTTANEIQNLVNELDLLFVGWYHCQIISSND